MANGGQVNILGFEPRRIRAAFDAVDETVPSVEYLIGYLRHIGVQAVVHEQVYLDRHFLDEFAEYYSRSFKPCSNACERLLFFASDLESTKVAFSNTFSGSETARHRAHERLQGAFRGFSVKRPLKNATVGRTVVRCYPSDNERRRYTALRPYRVHLPSGCALTVHGLAFQQQDVGAAVCASTALWSALQRVAFVSGHRSPTPVQVTKAANSPFPASSGLDDQQMATALSNLGYNAERFSVAENRALFRAAVAACLDSRLPVVLLLRKKIKTGAGEVWAGHAVTVTGYRFDTPSGEVPAPEDGGKTLKLRGAALDVVYVHDDNLGPHAHYELFDGADVDEFTGHASLMLRRGRNKKQDWWTEDEWIVEGGLVPKPAELRMDLSHLSTMVWRCRAIMELITSDLDLDLEYQARVTTGIEYKADVVEEGSGVDVQPFLECLSLPRHLGVVTVWLEGEPLFDFVLDVSETDRHGLPILALVATNVPADSSLGRQLEKVAAWKLEAVGGGDCPILLQ